MSGFKGKRNSYTCEECGVMVITQDMDEGVTPFMIKCRGTDGCEGHSLSGMYGKLPEVRPHFIWRKPTPEEYLKMGRGMKEHVDKGGLEIYSNNWEES